MLARVLAGSALLIPVLFSAQPVSAQRVSADIRIGGGPVAGHIRIGPDFYRGRGPRARVVRVEVLRSRDYYRRIDRLRAFRRDARAFVLYYDRDRDFYFDRFRPGLIEIQVFERGGRFYRWDDARFDRWMRDRWNDDRWDDRFDNRRDNRFDNRRDNRRDDRFDNRRDDRRDDRRDARRDHRDDRERSRVGRP